MNLREKIESIVKATVERALAAERGEADYVRHAIERVGKRVTELEGLRGRVSTLERSTVAGANWGKAVADLGERLGAAEELLALMLESDAGDDADEAEPEPVGEADAELVRSLLVEPDDEPKVLVGSKEISAALGVKQQTANAILYHYERQHGRLPRDRSMPGRPRLMVRADQLWEVARLGRAAGAAAKVKGERGAAPERASEERVRTRAEVLADPDRNLEALQARAEKTLLRAASRTKYATAARQATKAVRLPNRFVPLGHYPDPKKVREGVRHAFKREKNGVNVGRLSFKEEGRQLLARWAP